MPEQLARLPELWDMVDVGGADGLDATDADGLDVVALLNWPVWDLVQLVPDGVKRLEEAECQKSDV
jgi:hypothetical protein